MANNTGVEQIIQQFARDVSRQTGIDPRVIEAWEHAEGTYDTGGTGGFNMLNLRPYQGDPYSGVSPGGFELFSSLQAAESASVRRINQPFARAILDASQRKSPTPRQEIAAIASTGWDSGHYGGRPDQGGPALQRIYNSLFPGTLDKPIDEQAMITASVQHQTQPAIPGADTIPGFGAVQGAVTGGIQHIPGVKQGEAAVHAISSVGDFFGWITDPHNLIRLAEILGGFIMLVIGLYMLAKKQGSGTITQVASVAKGGE